MTTTAYPDHCLAFVSTWGCKSRRYLAEDVASAAPIPAFPDTWCFSLKGSSKSRSSVDPTQSK